MKNADEIANDAKGLFGANASKTLITLTAGAVVGAAAALLLAPKTGAETRKALADSAGKLVDSAGKVKETVSETLQKGITKLNGKVQEAESMVNSKLS